MWVGTPSDREFGVDRGGDVQFGDDLDRPRAFVDEQRTGVETHINLVECAGVDVEAVDVEPDHRQFHTGRRRTEVLERKPVVAEVGDRRPERAGVARGGLQERDLAQRVLNLVHRADPGEQVCRVGRVVGGELGRRQPRCNRVDPGQQGGHAVLGLLWQVGEVEEVPDETLDVVVVDLKRPAAEVKSVDVVDRRNATVEISDQQHARAVTVLERILCHRWVGLGAVDVLVVVWIREAEFRARERRADRWISGWDLQLHPGLSLLVGRGGDVRKRVHIENAHFDRSVGRVVVGGRLGEVVITVAWHKDDVDRLAVGTLVVVTGIWRVHEVGEDRVEVVGFTVDSKRERTGGDLVVVVDPDVVGEHVDGAAIPVTIRYRVDRAE